LLGSPVKRLPIAGYDLNSVYKTYQKKNLLNFQQKKTRHKADYLILKFIDRLALYDDAHAASYYFYFFCCQFTHNILQVAF